MFKKLIFVFFLGTLLGGVNLSCEGHGEGFSEDGFDALLFEEDDVVLEEVTEDELRSFSQKFWGGLDYCKGKIGGWGIKFLDRHLSLKRSLINLSAKYVEKQIEKYGEEAVDIKFLDKLWLSLSATGEALGDAKDEMSAHVSEVREEQRLKLFGEEKRKLTFKEELKLFGSVFRRIVMDNVPTNSKEIKEHWKGWKNAYIDFLLIPVAVFYGTRYAYRSWKSPDNPNPVGGAAASTPKSEVAPTPKPEDAK